MGNDEIRHNSSLMVLPGLVRRNIHHGDAEYTELEYFLNENILSPATSAPRRYNLQILLHHELKWLWLLIRKPEHPLQNTGQRGAERCSSPARCTRLSATAWLSLSTASSSIVSTRRSSMMIRPSTISVSALAPVAL